MQNKQETINITKNIIVWPATNSKGDKVNFL